METLDRELLLQNVDGDAELLREIVELFFESSDEIVRNLKTAVTGADADAVNRSAHQLKGALANVGACAAADAAARLEKLGRGGRLEGAGEALTSLEGELARLGPELRGLAASLD